MGLQEKRLIKEYKEGTFPKWKESFNELVGKDIEMDIKWETMTEENRGNQPDFYFDCWTKVYFNTLTKAFEDICKDDLGKEAVSEILKKITITGVPENSMAHSEIKFEKGNLVINHKPFSDIDSIGDRVKKITNAIGEAI